MVLCKENNESDNIGLYKFRLHSQTRRGFHYHNVYERVTKVSLGLNLIPNYFLLSNDKMRLDIGAKPIRLRSATMKKRKWSQQWMSGWLFCKGNLEYFNWSHSAKINKNKRHFFRIKYGGKPKLPNWYARCRRRKWLLSDKNEIISREKITHLRRFDF